eukprot:CAMPEP_0173388558 /NCGR_PEP_ID=MMETSP1356-20130122/10838_1 /TAXON_ID=77927 ORGANISM="Hemiselmis virescens, Strain PCC157" /NCGR_SAMPLE_ID=MMETSP1356 /ASSEMBLY_ACC=CAM_ASM_000847 /LENGTH=98 /DNA_ID=CAMNT_0014345497 /DNA_START=248 /DNA_END=545 /DNA_ORIENTATION=-
MWCLFSPEALNPPLCDAHVRADDVAFRGDRVRVPRAHACLPWLVETALQHPAQRRTLRCTVIQLEHPLSPRRVAGNLQGVLPLGACSQLLLVQHAGSA